MKLIMLPGMDGTGVLFGPLLAQLSDLDTEVVALPKEGPQDYPFLTEWVRERLPGEDFMILAESFSGPIAARLTRDAGSALKGVIFVGSFLSTPSPLAVSIARLLPVHQLARVPGASLFHRRLFLGPDADRETVNLFRRVIDDVPPATLKARLNSISTLQANNRLLSPTPAVYIRAKSDRLVSTRKAEEFAEAYSRLSVMEVEGPHFVLQANARGCAAAIRSAISLLATEAYDGLNGAPAPDTRPT